MKIGTHVNWYKYVYVMCMCVEVLLIWSTLLGNGNCFPTIYTILSFQ